MPACGLLVIVGKERISDRIARRGPDAMQNQVRHNVERLARQRKLARVVSCRDARLSKERNANRQHAGNKVGRPGSWHKESGWQLSRVAPPAPGGKEIEQLADVAKVQAASALQMLDAPASPSAGGRRSDVVRLQPQLHEKCLFALVHRQNVATQRSRRVPERSRNGVALPCGMNRTANHLATNVFL